jgi:hypothetical protein
VIAAEADIFRNDHYDSSLKPKRAKGYNASERTRHWFLRTDALARLFLDWQHLPDETASRLAERRQPWLFVMEACMPTFVLLAAAPCLVGLAVVLAVIRAKKEDLPAIVRALMRMGPRDDNREDDSRKTPPALPKP